MASAVRLQIIAARCFPERVSRLQTRQRVSLLSLSALAKERSRWSGSFPAHYSVDVDAPHFKKTKLDVVVEVAKIMTTLTVQMELGATSETVEVKSSAISLDTVSPVIGTTLEPELVKNAPIEINSLSRQIDAFMYLAPGVEGNASSHWINGGVTYENEVQFNGVPVAFVDFSGNQTYINPAVRSCK